MANRYLPYIALIAIYLIAAQLGNTFGQTLTIFSIFVWVIAAGLFLYLVLFRGLKLNLFSKNKSNDNESDHVLFGEDVAQEDADVSESNVQSLPPRGE